MCFLCLLQAVSCVFAICLECYGNPFRIHSRNVRNVFAICVLHIRHAKVWFLRQKSMVFGVQKGGFCVAKVCFLFFECYVVVNRSQRISWANVDISQNVCHIIPIC